MCCRKISFFLQPEIQALDDRQNVKTWRQPSSRRQLDDERFPPSMSSHFSSQKILLRPTQRNWREQKGYTAKHKVKIIHSVFIFHLNCSRKYVFLSRNILTFVYGFLHVYVPREGSCFVVIDFNFAISQLQQCHIQKRYTFPYL